LSAIQYSLSYTKGKNIMKKTLAAVAVLGAFAGSALAADVTVYGRIDTGLQLHNWEDTATLEGRSVSVDGTDWSMESGSLTGSRVGIKGSEQISEDLTVGFVLEKGFKGDTGTAAGGFDRESVLYVKSDFGTVYAGRINSMWSDGGSTNFWAGNYVALGTGNGVALGTGLMVGNSRADNRVSYVSPEFAGFKVYAEYSFGANDDENTSKTDRPAALGVNYNNGAFGAGMVVTYKNETSSDGVEAWDPEDEYTINIGTKYDFGVALVKVGAQYYKNADKVGAFSSTFDLDSDFTFDELEGYAVTVGADIPAWGGTWTMGVGYADGEDKGAPAGASLEYKGYDVAAYYQYPLSKRTKVYAGVGYEKLEVEAGVTGVVSGKLEHEDVKAMMGMAHYF